jgi:hypothetical protein
LQRPGPRPPPDTSCGRAHGRRPAIRPPWPAPRSRSRPAGPRSRRPQYSRALDDHHERPDQRAGRCPANPCLERPPAKLAKRKAGPTPGLGGAQGLPGRPSACVSLLGTIERMVSTDRREARCDHVLLKTQGGRDGNPTSSACTLHATPGRPAGIAGKGPSFAPPGRLGLHGPAEPSRPGGRPGASQEFLISIPLFSSASSSKIFLRK